MGLLDFINVITDVQRTTKRAGDSKKQYAYRNLNRLRKLRAWNWLLIPMLIAAAGLFAYSIIFAVVWFFGALFSFGNTGQLDEIVPKITIPFIVAAVLFVIYVAIKILTDILYLRAEKKELNENPEGAEKYLNVLEAVNKVNKKDIITSGIMVLFLILIPVSLFILPVISFILTGVLCIILIVSGIITQREFSKIKGDIAAIKQERKQNKFKAKQDRKNKTAAVSAEKPEVTEEEKKSE